MEIIIKNLNNKTVLLSEKKTILQSFAEHSIDWMQTCGGKGKCTTCKMIVLEGINDLEPLSEAEEKYKNENRLQTNERLACQAKPTNTATQLLIQVPQKYQLPHIKYTE